MPVGRTVSRRVGKSPRGAPNTRVIRHPPISAHMRCLYDADSAVEATVANTFGLQKRFVALRAAIPKRLAPSVAMNQLLLPQSVPATSATAAALLRSKPGPPREPRVFTHGFNVVDHKADAETSRPAHIGTYALPRQCQSWIWIIRI
jgi:hypothetical protein